MKNNLKPLPSTLREKRRYIVFEIVSEKKLNAKKLSNSVYKQIQNLIGEINMAKAGIIMLEGKDNKGIVSSTNKLANEVVSALTLVSYLDNQEVKIKTLGMSGILKKAKNKYL